MFAFFKNFLNKRRAQKLNAHIAKLETAFTLFQIIETEDIKTEKLVQRLSKDENYADLVSYYRVCVQKIGQHNDTIKSLIFAYNSLLKQYPIPDILENIETCSEDKLLDLMATVNQVYEYVIPNRFEHKKQYDEYKARLQDIIDNYAIIKEQKGLLKNIAEEISNLPDCYIDDESIEKALASAKDLLNKYCSYPKTYYPAPVINQQVIEKHNEQFIARHIKDEIFDDINGRSLDEEQRRAVLCNAKSNLTIAGAGSGKTLTICGKVKCGDFLALRKGKYGTFFGCHNYPRCKHTQQTIEEPRRRIGFYES